MADSLLEHLQYNNFANFLKLSPNNDELTSDIYRISLYHNVMENKKFFPRPTVLSAKEMLDSKQSEFKDWQYVIGIKQTMNEVTGNDIYGKKLAEVFQELLINEYGPSADMRAVLLGWEEFGPSVQREIYDSFYGDLAKMEKEDLALIDIIMNNKISGFHLIEQKNDRIAFKNLTKKLVQSSSINKQFNKGSLKAATYHLIDRMFQNDIVAQFPYDIGRFLGIPKYNERAAKYGIQQNPDQIITGGENLLQEAIDTYGIKGLGIQNWGLIYKLMGRSAPKTPEQKQMFIREILRGEGNIKAIAVNSAAGYPEGWQIGLIHYADNPDADWSLFSPDTYFTDELHVNKIYGKLSVKSTGEIIHADYDHAVELAVSDEVWSAIESILDEWSFSGMWDAQGRRSLESIAEYNPEGTHMWEHMKSWYDDISDPAKRMKLDPQQFNAWWSPFQTVEEFSSVQMDYLIEPLIHDLMARRQGPESSSIQRIPQNDEVHQYLKDKAKKYKSWGQRKLDYWQRKLYLEAPDEITPTSIKDEPVEITGFGKSWGQVHRSFLQDVYRSIP